MQCPECKGKASCVDTREQDFSRRRRYNCKCGKKFSTIEITESLDNLLRLPKTSLARRWFKDNKDAWIKTGMEIQRKRFREFIGVE